MPYQIFSGVFDSFEQTGVGLDVFESDIYVSKATRKLEEALAGRGSSADAYLLAPIVGLLLGEIGEVRVLDFGGGAGLSYVGLRQAINNLNRLFYHVVDNKRICDVGESIMPRDEFLKFFGGMSGIESSYDIVHFGSVLQYIADVPALLDMIAGLSPAYMLVSDAMVGTRRTFVTIADYYGLKHPHGFMSFEDMNAVFRRIGYAPVFTQPHISIIQGRPGFYDMTNLPEDCRLDSTVHILMKRM